MLFVWVGCPAKCQQVLACCAEASKVTMVYDCVSTMGGVTLVQSVHSVCLPVAFLRCVALQCPLPSLQVYVQNPCWPAITSRKPKPPVRTVCP